MDKMRKGKALMTSQSRKQYSEAYIKMAAQISKTILEARKAKGLTLRQLAAVTELSISFLCEIEKGKALPSLLAYADLCKALDIPPEIPLIS